MSSTICAGRRPFNAGPKVVELFAGAGLFGYAFREEGFRLNGAYERDRFAAQTYAKNLSSDIRVGDLATIRPEGRAEVLIAGPPCQGFSSLGRRDPNDPRNDLGLVIPNWAFALAAQVVVVENVAAYLKSNAWSRIQARFSRAGYETFVWILNAADLDTPQRRVRSFTIFSKKGRPPLDSYLKPMRKTVREAFAGLPSYPKKDIHHFALPSTELALKRIRLVPPTGDIRDIARVAPRLVPPSWFRTSGKIIDIWGRMSWDDLGPTIRTGFLHPSRGRFLHPEENRPISFREACRLQAIPDEIQFSGPARAVASQIGNGVPLTLGRRVARAVRHVF